MSSHSESCSPLTRRSLGALGLAVLLPRAGGAQGTWPDRPVRLIVPFGAGGAVDTLSRTVANAFPPHASGQALVVENRAGAGGTIAGAFVSQSRPDGYVLMMADLGANAIAQELFRGLPYDPTTAFTPVCHLVNLPIALITRANLEVRDTAGLIALLRERGDQVTYAHPGIGHATHLAPELLLRQAGVKSTPVPYRSGAEVLRSIIAGETDWAFPTVSTALPFIREGKVKVLAVGAKAPVSVLPDVPPLAATLPGFEATVWHGIVGPAGLPAEIVAAANRTFNAIMAMPEIRQQVQRSQAAEVIGGTPEAFGAFIRAEVERWTPVIRAAGIRAE